MEQQSEEQNHTSLEMDELMRQHQSEDEEDEEVSWYRRPIQHPTVKRVYNVVTPILMSLYLNAEWAGEKIADVLGITQSRFQYAIDEHNRLIARKSRKEAYIMKRLQEEWDKEQREREEAVGNDNSSDSSVAAIIDTVDERDGLQLNTNDDPEEGLIDISLDSPSKAL